MDPVRFLFSVTCNIYNPIVAIIILTVFIKLCCMPIEVLYYKNKIKYEKVKEYTEGIKRRKIRKKKERILLHCLNARKKRDILSLYAIEGTLLVLWVRTIQHMENVKILWFYMSEVDRSNRLAIIYVVIVIFLELVDVEKDASIIGKIVQVIMNVGMAIFMFSVVKGLSAGTTIYWIVYSIYQTISKHFYFNGYLKRKMEYQYSTKYLNEVEKMMEKEGGFVC